MRIHPTRDISYPCPDGTLKVTSATNPAETCNGMCHHDYQAWTSHLLHSGKWRKVPSGSQITRFAKKKPLNIHEWPDPLWTIPPRPKVSSKVGQCRPTIYARKHGGGEEKGSANRIGIDLTFPFQFVFVISSLSHQPAAPRSWKASSVVVLVGHVEAMKREEDSARLWQLSVKDAFVNPVCRLTYYINLAIWSAHNLHCSGKMHFFALVLFFFPHPVRLFFWVCLGTRANTYFVHASSQEREREREAWIESCWKGKRRRERNIYSQSGVGKA